MSEGAHSGYGRIDSPKRLLSALSSFKQKCEAGSPPQLLMDEFFDLFRSLASSAAFNDELLTATVYSFTTYDDLLLCYTTSVARLLTSDCSLETAHHILDIMCSTQKPHEEAYTHYFIADLPQEIVAPTSIGAHPERVSRVAYTVSSVLDRYMASMKADAEKRALEAKRTAVRAGMARARGASGDQLIYGARRARNLQDLASGSFAAVDSEEPTITRPAPYASPAVQKQALSSAWLELTAYFARNVDSLPPALLRHLLEQLAPRIPWIESREKLLDFFTATFHLGGMISLLALEGVMALMTTTSVEFPDFYKQVYNLITPQAFLSANVPDFARRLGYLLASPHIPASTAAAFVKKICRLSLSAPAPAIVAFLPIALNILIRTPSAFPHATGSEDLYDPDERDPTQAHALESELWELKALAKHYHPTVCRLASCFNDGARPEILFDVGTLSELDWKGLFQAEATRKPPHGEAVATQAAKPSGIFQVSVPKAYQALSTADITSAQELSRIQEGTHRNISVTAEIAALANASVSDAQLTGSRVAYARTLNALFSGWNAGLGADEA